MAKADHEASLPSMAGLGIIAALPGEARALARLRPRGQARLAGGGRLRLSGMGAERAAVAAEQLADEGATALMSWGTTAALAPGIDPGAIVLPAEIIAANGGRWIADRRWRESLAGRLAPRHAVHEGALIESLDVVSDAAAKRRLYDASGAIACDMESAAIATVAARRGLRFVALRAVIDDATMALPPVALAAMDADGHLQVRALLAAMTGRPPAVHAQLRSLKQLAVAFRAARASLGDAASVVLSGASS
ncbi:hypothetical protein V5738_14685 [Salinisphaera sp. SPP-AMP-43]|uniref:phosphorylase family protein n=1 Tax=Salinisphaera sp. SPP-AMP-43 TaxID=3121288 RepID=UPI003C6E4989